MLVVHSAFKTVDRTIWGCVRGSVSLHHQFYNCTNSPPHPTPSPLRLPTMLEQWCSNKAILNDEHTRIPWG